MAGGARARAWRAVQRWWRAPATLEVLVGPEQYGLTLGKAWTRLALLGWPIGACAVFIDGSVTGRGALGMAILLVFLAVVVSLFRRVSSVSRNVLLAGLLSAAGLLGFWVAHLGPRAGESAAVVAVAAAMASIWMPRRWAILACAVGGLVYAASLVARDVDHAVPRWIVVVGLAVLVVTEMSWMLDRVQELAEQERRASEEAERLAIAEHAAREELAELNRTLEERVQQQVGEIEGLGRLRQFVPSQVADAALTGSLLPHRRQIAVVFSDLRGFSAFSNTSEPEEILEVLEAYYAVVGVALREYQATAGPFQGDGIIAYFNDPVPCDDPAGRAVAMALSLQEPLDELCLRWARRGFDLGHAIGIAYGYATLGTVGFEGRTDYTPLGAVVNMALRLRDEADWGEILIDGRTHHAIDGRVVADPCLLELKGFEGQVQAYRIRSAPGL